MAVTIRYSVILALAVTLVSILFVTLGLHRDVVSGTLIYLFLVIGIDVIVIFLALRKSAGQVSYADTS